MTTRQFKYIVTAEKILEEYCNKLHPGDLLPHPAELCEHYNVSMITINKALALLVERGIIKRTPRKGTELLAPVSGVQTQISEKKTILKILTLEKNNWSFAQYIEGMLQKYCNKNRKAGYMIIEKSIRDYRDAVGQDDYDIVMTGIWTMREFITDPELNKLFRPLNDMPNLWFDREYYISHVLRWCGLKDRLLALPMNFTTVLSQYNLSYPGIDQEKISEQLTFKQFTRLLQDSVQEPSMHSIASYPFFLRFTMNTWPILIRRFGGRIMSDDGSRCLLGSPEVIEAIRYLVELIFYQKLCLPIGIAAIKPGYDLFNLGKFLCTWQSSKHDFSKSPFKTQLAPLPHASGKKENPIWIESLMFPESGKNAALAIDFVNFLQLPQHQEEIRNTCDMLPPQRGPLKKHIKKMEKLVPGFEFYADGLDKAEPLIPFPRYRVMGIIHEKMYPTWLGLETPEESCGKIAEEINAILEKSISS